MKYKRTYGKKLERKSVGYWCDRIEDRMPCCWRDYSGYISTYAKQIYRGECSLAEALSDLREMAWNDDNEEYY